MERIDCRMGHTQVGRLLAHARRETQLLKVQALVFVGDAMEENPDNLYPDASELGRLGVPAFMFQEGTAVLLSVCFATSPASPAAPTAALTPERRGSWPSSCGR